MGGKIGGGDGKNPRDNNREIPGGDKERIFREYIIKTGYASFVSEREREKNITFSLCVCLFVCVSRSMFVDLEVCDADRRFIEKEYKKRKERTKKCRRSVS